MKKNKILKKNGLGFSLLELVIVVAIIGLLAVVGRSKFSYFVGKARRAEMIAVVDTYKKMQETFYAVKDFYGDVTEIGFANYVNPIQLEYQWVYIEDLVPAPASYAEIRLRTGVMPLCTGGGVEEWQYSTATGEIERNFDGLASCN